MIYESLGILVSIKSLIGILIILAHIMACEKCVIPVIEIISRSAIFTRFSVMAIFTASITDSVTCRTFSSWVIFASTEVAILATNRYNVVALV